MDLSAEFPILSEMIFFNHAGVAPISARAAKAICDYAVQAESRAYVKSGWYRRLAEVKRLTATLINARGPHEIAFVPNTSTGLSMVAKGLPWREGDNIVITNVEYPANRYPWLDLQRFGVEVREVAETRHGRIDVEDVVDAINNRTRLVAISHVQWASGYRVDLRPISEVVHHARGFLCVDGIQSVGLMPVDVRDSGIDFLSADGHKWLLGPEGAGILYCREDLIEMLHPNVVGWMNMIEAHDYGNYRFEFERDARRFEPGSYNVPGTLALGASMELLMDVGIDEVWHRVERLTAHLCEGLRSRGYDIFSPRGDAERSGSVVFCPPQGASLDCKRIVGNLEAQGIVIAVRQGRLRASPHFYNTIEQIDRLVDALP